MAVGFDYDDLVSRYPGDLEAFEREYVERQIADVVGYAEAEVPGIQGRLATGSLAAVVYKRVIADAVNRVLLNPYGRTNENEGGVGYGRDARVASGRIWFPDDDRKRLRGVAATVFVPGTVRLGVQQ